MIRERTKTDEPTRFTQMIHQENDLGYKILVAMVRNNPQVQPFVKGASLDGMDDLPKVAFAWEDKRMFPIHTKEDASLSYIYIQKNTELGTPVPSLVKEAVEKALRLFDVDPEKLQLQQKKEAFREDENQSYYLLPQKKRWDVRTAEHVKIAEEAILEHKRSLGVAERTRAAKLLVKRAEDLGVPVSIETQRAAGNTASDLREVNGWLDARITQAPTLSPYFRKIGEWLESSYPISYDQDALLKLASAIEKIDSAAGLEKFYGKVFPDPVDTVFNFDKLAEKTIDLAGQQIPVSKLAGVSKETLSDIFGDELVEEADDGSGNLDQDKLVQLINTMPRDLKKVLAKLLK